MVISGYGIQVATSPVWRGGLAWVHGVSAGLFLLAYFGHLAFRGWQPDPVRGGGAVELTTGSR
jgi:hypothetical protein